MLLMLSNQEKDEIESTFNTNDKIAIFSQILFLFYFYTFWIEI